MDVAASGDSSPESATPARMPTGDARPTHAAGGAKTCPHGRAHPTRAAETDGRLGIGGLSAPATTVMAAPSIGCSCSSTTRPTTVTSGTVVPSSFVATAGSAATVGSFSDTPLSSSSPES